MVHGVGPGKPHSRRGRGSYRARACWRGLAALTVGVMILALPAAALAAFHALNGPVGSGAGNAGVEVHFISRGAHIKYIKRFGFFNVPATCMPSGTTAVSGSFPRRIRVSANKFHSTQTVHSGSITYTAKGQFRSLHKAVGTIRIKGATAGCGSADTGRLKWHATG